MSHPGHADRVRPGAMESNPPCRATTWEDTRPGMLRAKTRIVRVNQNVVHRVTNDMITTDQDRRGGRRDGGPATPPVRLHRGRGSIVLSGGVVVRYDAISGQIDAP